MNLLPGDFFSERESLSQKINTRLKVECLYLPVNLRIKYLDIMLTKYFPPINKRMQLVFMEPPFVIRLKKISNITLGSWIYTLLELC